jgi:hypothetical protein
VLDPKKPRFRAPLERPGGRKELEVLQDRSLAKETNAGCSLAARHFPLCKSSRLLFLHPNLWLSSYSILGLCTESRGLRKNLNDCTIAEGGLWLTCDAKGSRDRTSPDTDEGVSTRRILVAAAGITSRARVDPLETFRLAGFRDPTAAAIVFFSPSSWLVEVTVVCWQPVFFLLLAQVWSQRPRSTLQYKLSRRWYRFIDMSTTMDCAGCGLGEDHVGKLKQCAKCKMTSCCS